MKNTLITLLLLFNFKSLLAQKPELVLPKGHTKSLQELAFSPDGKLVLSASFDNTAKLWHTATGRQLKTFNAHFRWVNAVSFTTDGKYGITAGDDKRLKLWDLTTGEEIRNYGSTETLENFKIGKDSRELKGHNYGVNDVAMHPNGKTFYTCSYETMIQWDLETGEIVNQIYEGAYKVKISPDGKYLAFLKMGKLYLYNLQTRKLEREIGFHTDHVLFKGGDHKCEESCIGHAARVRYFAFNAQSNQIATSGGDKLVMLWDVATGKKLATYGEHDHPTYSGNTTVIKSCNDNCQAIKNDINSVGFASGGKQLVAAGGKQVAVWDINNPKLSQFYELDIWTNKMAIHPNGRYIVVGSSQGISFFDLQQGKEVHGQPGYQEGQSEIALSPDGRTAITGRFYNKAQSWDITTGQLIHNYNSFFDDDFTDDNGSIQLISFDEKGEKVLIGGQHKELKLWDVHSGEALMEFENARFGNTAGDLSLDGSKAIAANYREIQVWDTRNPNPIFKFEEHGKFDNIFKMKITADGKRAYAVGDYRTIYVYDIENGVELKPFGKHKVHLDSDKKMKKSEWTPRAGRCVPGCYGHTGDIRTLDISKDNKRLLTGGENEWILWDVETQKIIQRAEITDHRAGINCLVFMKGEDKVIGSYTYQTKASHWKSKLKIWDVETGLVVKAFQTSVKEFVLSQDEKYLITRTGRVDLEKDELINQRLYFKDPNDFMYITPDNYYYASKNGAKQLHFVKGLQPYSFDQFDLIYNRPDIVLKQMGMAPQKLVDSYKAAYIKRLEKMGFDNAKILQFLRGDAINDLSAPEVYLDQKISEFLKTYNRNIAFRYKAIDPKGKSIKRLFVEVNGVPLMGAKGVELNHTSKDTLRGEFLGVPLSKGLNKIAFSVMNEDGIYSLKQAFEVTFEGPIKKPNLHVVAIGISKYQDTEMNLDYAAKDAKDLSNLLATHQGNYGQVFTYPFLNEKATKANILAVKEKLKKTQVDDKVVVFVAGHGLLDEKLDYYIATHDVDFVNPAEKGLPYEALESLLDGIPARKKLMLIDACHSGEVDKEEIELTANNQQSGTVKYRGFKNKGAKNIGLTNSFELMQELFNDLRTGTGAMVISAASGVEFSYESPEWNNGVFTYSIMEGLKTKNADKDANNEITVTELRDYAIKRVVELTNGKQNPTSRSENLEFDFRVW